MNSGSRFSLSELTPSLASPLVNPSISSAVEASKVGPARRSQLFSAYLVQRMALGAPSESWTATSDDFRLAVTVAALAEVLRESPYVGDVTLAQVAAEAEALSPGNGAVDELARLVDDIILLS